MSMPKPYKGTSVSIPGGAQDFMAAIATKGLFQIITALTYVAGHIDLIFTVGKKHGDLMEGINITPLQ